MLSNNSESYGKSIDCWHGMSDVHEVIHTCTQLTYIPQRVQVIHSSLASRMLNKP